MFKYNLLLCTFSLQFIFFSEQSFYGNYMTLDSRTTPNTVVSHTFAYSSRWRRKSWQGLLVDEICWQPIHSWWNFFSIYVEGQNEKSGRILCSLCIFFSKSVRQIVARKPAQQLIFNFDIKEPIASPETDRSRAVESLFLFFLFQVHLVFHYNSFFKNISHTDIYTSLHLNLTYTVHALVQKLQTAQHNP